jgi:hypothetical protein
MASARAAYHSVLAVMTNVVGFTGYTGKPIALAGQWDGKLGSVDEGRNRMSPLH